MPTGNSNTFHNGDNYIFQIFVYVNQFSDLYNMLKIS